MKAKPARPGLASVWKLCKCNFTLVTERLSGLVLLFELG